ncbi:MAG: hypothetical protein V1873_04660 [Verrucomicrobiota bacterium]
MCEQADAVERYKGQAVVVDLESQYVVLGTLVGTDHRYFELENADVHDLRDAKATRDLYTVQAKKHGFKINRKHVLVPRDQVVSISALDDVTK